MNYITAVIFGIVEGVTEFLPISSTAHLDLAREILKTASTDFFKSFQIAIQLGAILSVVVLYWKSFLLKFSVFKKILAAFIPTALIGLILYKSLKSFLLGNITIELCSLAVGGLFIIIFEIFYRQKETAIDDIGSISYPKAFLIGIFQSIAIIPGVSRSAATIIGGLILGLKRKTIVEFSFLLAVPTMLAATVLDLAKSAPCFNPGQFIYLAIGFIVSFITALLAIKFLLYFVQKHNFIPFGVYRIVAVIIFLFYTLYWSR